MKKFYHNKRILVTGHTGFKGSWLTAVLNNFGAHVIGFSLQARKQEMFELIGGEALCSHHVGDIRDLEAFRKVIVESKPDLIFHLAAQPLVLESYADPLNTIGTNVVGTVHLLEILREKNITTPTIVVTTDKVYKNEEIGKSFLENDPLGGSDVYSGSKAAVEILANSYQQSFPFLNIVTARAGNVIGGGDFSANRIIPDIIRAYNGEAKFFLRHPNAVRPWQHVLESIKGYLLLGMEMDRENTLPRALNFGPEPSSFQTVAELVAICEQYLGKKIPQEKIEGSSVKEANFLTLDSTLVKHRLGWNTKWDISETVRLTLDWYLYGVDDKLSITEKQIELYFSEF